MDEQSFDRRSPEERDHDARRDIANRLRMLADQLNGNAHPILAFQPWELKAHTLAVLDRCKHIAGDMK